MWGLLWATFGGAHADVSALLLRGTATAAVKLIIVIVIVLRRHFFVRGRTGRARPPHKSFSFWSTELSKVETITFTQKSMRVDLGEKAKCWGEER